jgi:chromosome segregation ATPase
MPTQQVVGSSSTSSRSPSAIRPDTGTQTSLSVVKNDLERSLRIIGRLEEQAVTDATSKSLHDERLSDLEKSRREANDAKRELEDSRHEIEDAKKVARTSREDLAVAKLSEAEHRRTAEQWQRRHEELTEDFRNKIMELERLKQAHVEVTEQLEKATGKIARFQS